MKIGILFLLFSVNCFAGMFTSKAYLLREDCNIRGASLHTKIKKCNLQYLDCVKKPDNYNCKIDSEQDTQVDDPTKPIYSKNSETACSGEEDCRNVADLLNCPPDERGLTYAPWIEAYCSSYPFPTGYQQKTILVIREDATKKAAYDAIQLAKSNAETLRKTRVTQMRGLISKLKAGQNLTIDERRVLDLLLIKKLRE